METIAFDSHKNYTLSMVEDDRGKILDESRIEHKPGAIYDYLRRFTPGSPVAVETVGNWYWLVDEIESAGMKPLLVNARKAKLMLGNINKTDRLDARGLNLLQRTGTLPTVWIPPMSLRDRRELCRTRMRLISSRTRVKNRIHASLARYGLKAGNRSDLFGPGGLKELARMLEQLPEHTRYTVELQVEEVQGLTLKAKALEEKMRAVYSETDEIRLLQTLPGIGFLLGVVIAGEVGVIGRFATPEKFSSYAGVVPRVHSSGGKTFHGKLRSDVNRYLKWAFVEAANVVSINRRKWVYRHVTRVYERIRAKRGHAKAIGAVARHLAEAAFWVLTRHEPYKDPAIGKDIPSGASARCGS